MEGQKKNELSLDFKEEIEDLSLPCRKKVLFSFERSTERMIWVWLVQAMALAVYFSFDSFVSRSKLWIVAWLVYSAALVLWANYPSSWIYKFLKDSVKQDEQSQVYDNACGIKETIKTFLVLMFASVLFWIALFLLGKYDI